MITLKRPLIHLTLALASAALTSASGRHAQAAEPAGPASERPARLPVYGEAGVGFGQTLFFGGMRDALRKSYGGAFDPGIGNNLMMGFTVAPLGWRGVGVGARIKGTFGTSIKGEQGDDYIFNYYALALAVKAYPFAKTFNDGLYARASVGFGQMTTKRQNEALNRYRHQYAIGLTAAGALGYTLPVGPVGLGVEAEFEFSSRDGTVDGVGATSFQSGQLGGNFVVSF
jgi:hypothetical protein